MHTFTTSGLSGRRKMVFWNDVSSATFAEMEVVPADVAGFQGCLNRAALGPLALAEVCSSAGSIHHTRSHIVRAPVRRHVLMLPTAGGCRVHPDRQPDFELGTGECCLLDQARPYRLAFDREVRAFCVILSDDAFGDVLPDSTRIANVPIRPQNSMARMLIQVLDSLGAELRRGAAGGMGSLSARRLTGFIAAACAEITEPEAPSQMEGRRRAIRLYVDQNLHDPDLSPSQIARHFGFSTRYLRLLFEDAPERIPMMILRRRLECCARLLRDPRWRQRTVTEIAFRSGFDNASYFGCAFKRHYGLSPREYRRASGVAAAG